MRPEQARKLNRLIVLSRLRTAAKIAAIIVPIVALLLWLAWPDPTLRASQVEGVVTHWSREQAYTGIGRLVIWATLTDGSKIRLTSRSVRSPQVGDRIRLERWEKSSGAVIYRLLD